MLYILSLKKKRLMYLFQNGVTKREERQRRNFHPLVHSTNGHNSPTGAGPGHSWEPGSRSFFQVSNTGKQGPNMWAIFHGFSQAITGELGRNWSSQDIKRHLKVLALPVMSQCNPCIFLFKSHFSNHIITYFPHLTL